jgi:predicted pyridoxine 5'-phosphate oxidase superfamily flavin-nucleotide-binding protein
LVLCVQFATFVEHEARSFVIEFGVRDALKVIEDATLELPNFQTALREPCRGFLAANAARAVHGNLFALPLGEFRLEVRGEVAEVVHAGVDRAFEATELEFERVAVVDDDDIFALEEVAPLFG